MFAKSLILSFFRFKHIKAAQVFYDNLNVHHGPHLGAHLTLAMPYVMAIYGKEMEKVAKYGLKKSQVRISVGLEKTELLLEDFKIALDAADGAEDFPV